MQYADIYPDDIIPDDNTTVMSDNQLQCSNIVYPIYDRTGAIDFELDITSSLSTIHNLIKGDPLAVSFNIESGKNIDIFDVARHPHLIKYLETKYLTENTVATVKWLISVYDTNKWPYACYVESEVNAMLGEVDFTLPVESFNMFESEAHENYGHRDIDEVGILVAIGNGSSFEDVSSKFLVSIPWIERFVEYFNLNGYLPSDKRKKKKGKKLPKYSEIKSMLAEVYKRNKYSVKSWGQFIQTLNKNFPSCDLNVNSTTSSILKKKYNLKIRTQKMAPKDDGLVATRKDLVIKLICMKLLNSDHSALFFYKEFSVLNTDHIRELIGLDTTMPTYSFIKPITLYFQILFGKYGVFSIRVSCWAYDSADCSSFINQSALEFGKTSTFAISIFLDNKVGFKTSDFQREVRRGCPLGLIYDSHSGSQNNLANDYVDSIKRHVGRHGASSMNDICNCVRDACKNQIGKTWWVYKKYHDSGMRILQAYRTLSKDPSLSSAFTSIILDKRLLVNWKSH